MGSLPTQFINMLMLGSTYSLVAIGFSLFFGVMNVVVFCVGDVAIFAAYAVAGLVAFTSLQYIVVGGGSLWLSAMTVIIASLLTGLLMLIMYKVAIKPLARKGSHMPLLSTIAVGLALREGIAVFFPQGRNPVIFPALMPDMYFFNNPILSYRNLVILGATVLILIGLYFFVSRTKPGLSVQAVAQNHEGAIMLGINSEAVVLVTLLLGGFVLGIGGYLLGSYYGMIRYEMGVMYGLKGFSAAVVGGIGNINGAIVGGLLLATVEVLMSAFVPGGTAYASIASFIVVLLLLLTRPEGIMGKKTIENV